MRLILNLFLSMLLFSSCNRHPLLVQTQYLSRNSLASYYVETPDPKLDNPDVGEQLIVQWFLPKNRPSYSNIFLRLNIRFHNREEITRAVPIDKASGTYIYTILNQDFFKSKGILTYKVQLIDNDNIIDEWQHQLWAELIILQK